MCMPGTHLLNIFTQNLKLTCFFVLQNNEKNVYSTKMKRNTFFCCYIMGLALSDTRHFNRPAPTAPPPGTLVSGEES